MTVYLPYSSVLTGAAFLLYEFKQVTKLKNHGLTDQEIKQKVIDENIFQYEKMSSLKRGLPSILRRVNALDEKLRYLATEESIDATKVINLYAIMKTDRLFFEFMEEVIKMKLMMNDDTLEKRDLNIYFTEKAEKNAEMANWTEATTKKLKQVFIKILLDTGMLKDKHSGELKRLIIDEAIKSHLYQIGDKRYIQAMGDEM